MEICEARWVLVRLCIDRNLFLASFKVVEFVCRLAKRKSAVITMDTYLRPILNNERTLQKYLVLSPSVLKVAERDRLLPIPVIDRLRMSANDPGQQNRLLLDFLLAQPDGEKYFKRFTRLLRTTQQGWLAEVMDSGKSLDDQMLLTARFASDDIDVIPPGYATGVPKALRSDFRQMAASVVPIATDNRDAAVLIANPGRLRPYNRHLGSSSSMLNLSVVPNHDLMVATGARFNADGYPSFTVDTSLKDLTRTYYERQLNNERSYMSLQREAAELRATLIANQRRQEDLLKERDALGLLSTQLERLAHAGRKVELNSFDYRTLRKT